MIDYEKLTEAHHICVGTDLYVSAEFGHLGGVFIYILNKSQNRRLFETKDTDDLITKLKELTKPEPKYAVGETVWYLYSFGGGSQLAPYKSEVLEILSGGESVGTFRHEVLVDDCYPTRGGLIKAQIMHWHELLLGEPKASCCSVHAGGYEECAREDDAHKKPEECVHEYQNNFGEDSRPRYVKAQKPMCKKCGEFYR